MAVDYTKLLAKLQPDPGGEDVLRLRTGVVTAFNGDGTVDLLLSGVTVPDVPYLLTGGSVGVGAVVQVIVYRGSLLVLGPSGTTNQPAATLYDEVSTDASTTSATGVAYMSVELPSAGSYTFDVMWILSVITSDSLPGWALGGTATPASWSWSCIEVGFNAAAGSGGSRGSGTSYPTNVGAAAGGSWTNHNTGFGAINAKGKVTVNAAGRLDFRLGRFSGSGTITVRAQSCVTVTTIG